MSDIGAKVDEFLKQPDPYSQADYRRQYKRYKGVIPDRFLESLKVIAAERGWTLEDK